MLAEVTGLQVVAPVDGGSANKGQDVVFKLRVNNGKSDSDLTFFIENDKLAILISHLITYGGMARNTRMARNPQEEADNTYASGHALGLQEVITGRSVTDPAYAILTLQFDAGQDRKLNLHCAADADHLQQLRNACDQATALLQNGNPEPLKH